MANLAMQRQGAMSQRLGKSTVVNIPSPIGGWNAREALGAMPPTDAIRMDNWFPGFGSVALRRGYSSFVGSGMGTGNVETLVEYRSGTTQKFLAAANGNIYDITSGTASSLTSGFSENRWQTVGFNGKTGFVNGTDTPQVYDGSTVGAMTLTGPTAANVIGVAAYRSRTYFWEDDSQSFWYSAVNALGGSVTEFNLSRVGQFGGNIIAVGTWSLGGASDAWGGGGQIQDVICFFMSSGEVVIYEGDDPGANFVLIGVYHIGAPLDVRGVAKVADDLVVLTKDGYIPMSQVLRQGRLAAESAVSDKIRGAVRTATREYAGNTGWQAIAYHKGGYLLVNVPRSATTFEQHIMNIATGAWCRFTNQNAPAWGIYDDHLYFGTTDGKVMKADDGLSDNSSNIGGTDGAIIRSAPSDLGTPFPKYVSAIRPIFSGTGDVSIGISLESDFEMAGPTSAEVSLAAPTASWEDVDVLWEEWDTNWETGDAEAFYKWLVRKANGVLINTRVLVEIQDAAEWFATDYRFTTGNAL